MVNYVVKLFVIALTVVSGYVFSFFGLQRYFYDSDTFLLLYWPLVRTTADFSESKIVGVDAYGFLRSDRLGRFRSVELSEYAYTSLFPDQETYMHWREQYTIPLSDKWFDFADSNWSHVEEGFVVHGRIERQASWGNGIVFETVFVPGSNN